MKSFFITAQVMLAVIASAMPTSTTIETAALLTLAQLEDKGPGDCPKADFLRLMFESSMYDFQKASRGKNPTTCDFSTNGCTRVPDVPLGQFNFRPSCDRHAFGIRNAKRRNALTKHLLERVDDQFRRDMYAVCDRLNVMKSFLCRHIANTYYVGEQGFQVAQLNAKNVYDEK